MGGNVFGSSISTPRMSPDIYNRVRLQVLSILRQHYSHADSAIEAPKQDHGDIDVLVTGPLDSEENVSKPQHLATILGATQWEQNGPTTHFALPWPETSKEDAAHFIQLDVRTCPDVTNFKWNMFFLAHGDLWSMLGTVIRRYGLSCSDKGLFIRIIELEGHNKNLARVKLTDNPSVVLAYLGLDEDKYWERFEDSEAMMDYAASCRFHDPMRGCSPEKGYGYTTHTSDETNEDKLASLGPQITGRNSSENKNRSFLKANDRQRIAKRPLFRAWIDNYLPSHRHGRHNDKPLPAGSAAHLTRDGVITDAKDFFGPEFAASFDERRAEGMKTVAESRLWPLIRKVVPVTGEVLGFVMRGLKREISSDSGNQGMGKGKGEAAAAAEVVLGEVQKAYAQGRFGEVQRWAVENWEAVEARQREFEKENE